MAKDNFAREMRRHRAFFKKHGIMYLIFPDDGLMDTRQIFDEFVLPCLEPEKANDATVFRDPGRAYG